MNSKISIIIPCYNDHKFIKESVSSAIAQSYKNKEIIVVDDGSNEITKNVLKELEPKIDILITQENLGVSAARNNGIKISTGRYILNLDSDDYFEPQFCEKAIKEFQNDQRVEIVTCHANWFKNKGEFKIFKPRGGTLNDVLFNNVAMGSAMFLRNRWHEVGGYDEKMLKGYEDWEFYIRLLKEGGKAKVIPEVLFNYRNRKDSRNDRANLIKYQLREYILIKHSNLYKDNFEACVSHLMGMMNKEQVNWQRKSNSLEYKIGKTILWPLRKIKNL